MKRRNKPLVSVVVPIYNAERYLDECLDSIARQTYEEIEVILVDDGSDDGSGKIIDKYAVLDKRIKVLKKKNGGVADARNFGMENAKGEYIAFVDSDDYLENIYIERLVKIADIKRADVVQCGYSVIVENRRFDSNGCSMEFSGLDAIRSMLYQSDISSALWGKIIRKTLFKGVDFPKDKLHEDLWALYCVLKKSKKVVAIDDDLYNYRFRKDSLIHSAFSEHTLDILDILEKIKKDMGEDTYCKKAFESRKVNANFFVLRQLPKGREILKKTLWLEIRGMRARVLKDPMVRRKTKLGLRVSYFGLPFVKFMYNLFASSYNARRVQ